VFRAGSKIDAHRETIGQSMGSMPNVLLPTIAQDFSIDPQMDWRRSACQVLALLRHSGPQQDYSRGLAGIGEVTRR
jgi:hypothetical protein